MQSTRALFESAIAALLMSAGLGVAVAATPVRVSSDIQAQYERERAVCLSGQSNQDRATCLKEAGAAREEARRGQLQQGSPDYRRNQLQRCDALKGDDAKDCRLRIEGAGTTSGSAAEGGILRELVTIVPAPAAPVPAPTPAQ